MTALEKARQDAASDLAAAAVESLENLSRLETAAGRGPRARAAAIAVTNAETAQLWLQKALA